MTNEKFWDGVMYLWFAFPVLFVIAVFVYIPLLLVLLFIWIGMVIVLLTVPNWLKSREETRKKYGHLHKWKVYNYGKTKRRKCSCGRVEEQFAYATVLGGSTSWTEVKDGNYMTEEEIREIELGRAG